MRTISDGSVGKTEKHDYLAVRKEWKLKCKERELEWKEEQLMELKTLKKESQVWEYIGKRKRKGLVRMIFR